jgi:TolB-like protein
VREAGLAVSRQRLSREEASTVRRHFQDIVASKSFATSKRAQDFLRLIVEHALAGEFDNLRERQIGIEMFGRAPDYDTANDPVVRVKATEVRKKLNNFYLETEGESRVRIQLPSGSYVPRFVFDQSTKAAEVPPIASPSPYRGSTEPGDVSKSETIGEKKRNDSKTWPSFSWRVFASAAFAAALAVISGWLGYVRWHHVRRAEIRSIVVLPFENRSGDHQQGYLAEGITEGLIADLGQISALRVISKTSAMNYRGTTKKPPQIARELNVDGVIEGSVQSEGSQVRVSARLVDARTGRVDWADTYVQDLSNVFVLQGELAKAVADEAGVKLTPQTRARFAHVKTVNSEAEEMYLQGMVRLNEDDAKGALNFFERAISIDPNFADAHAALAACYGWLGETEWLPYTVAFSKQRDEALRAIELDSSLPQGHAELANALMDLNWDWTASEKEFYRALELNPNSAETHIRFAILLVRTGRGTEAIAEAERARALDPFSSHVFLGAVSIYYDIRYYDRVATMLTDARTQGLNLKNDAYFWGAIYLEKAMYAKSISAFRKAGANTRNLGHLGNAYARAGQVDSALKIISAIQKQLQPDGTGAYEIALVYAGLDRKDQAFAWLGESFKAHSEGLSHLLVDPCLDPLRSDPRFSDLLRKVGLS